MTTFLTKWRWKRKLPNGYFGVFGVVLFALFIFGYFWWNTADKTAVRFVRANLLDSDSAKFSDVEICRNRSGTVSHVSGLVNAKNSFGGYTGNQQFLVSFGSGEPTFAYFDSDNSGRLLLLYTQQEVLSDNFLGRHRNCADIKEAATVKWSEAMEKRHNLSTTTY